MTLEEMVVNRLVNLAAENAKLARLADEHYREVLRLRDERDAAIAAHAHILKRVDELEKQAGKRGGKRAR